MREVWWFPGETASRKTCRSLCLRNSIETCVAVAEGERVTGGITEPKGQDGRRMQG